MDNNCFTYSIVRFSVLWAPIYYLVLLLSGYVSPEEILIVYAFETVIIGIFHFVKLILAGVAQNKTKGALFISIFFLIHYGIFCFAQLFLFFAVLNVNLGVDSGFWDEIIYFLEKPEIRIPLLMLIPIYFFNFWKDFLNEGLAYKVEIGSFMFLPNARVFIQQFVGIFPYFIAVILGFNQKIIAAALLIVLRALLEFFIQWVKTNRGKFEHWAVKMRTKDKSEADAYRSVSEALNWMERASGRSLDE